MTGPITAADIARVNSIPLSAWIIGPAIALPVFLWVVDVLARVTVPVVP